MQQGKSCVKLKKRVFFLTYQANFYKIDTWQGLAGQVLWGVEEEIGRAHV